MDFIGFLAAGSPHGDFLQLLFELFLGQLAALQAIACLDDFFDVELEDIAPAKLALGALAPPQEYPEPAPAFLQRELYFLSDFVIVRSEEHTSELQSQSNLVCRLLLEKKKN